MRPFNLEEALKDPSKVCTRCGEDVLELHLFKDVLDINSPLVASVKDVDGEVTIRVYTPNGGFGLLPYDLFMKSTKKSGWINIYELEKPCAYVTRKGGVIFETKEEANAAVWTLDPFYKKTVKIEWEE